MLNRIYAELGQPPRMNAMGGLMLRLGGLFIPEARETVEMLYEFNRPFVLDSSRCEQMFGLRPTPTDEALRRTIAWYRTHAASSIGASAT